MKDRIKNIYGEDTGIARQADTATRNKSGTEKFIFK
jgi:hypothetical protein